MKNVVVAGAGAFGTALALSLDRGGRNVRLFARNAAAIASSRTNPRLPDVDIPASIEVTSDLIVTHDDILLLAVPMQALAQFLADMKPQPFAAIACCKGVDLTTGKGPTAIIRDTLSAPSGILTGPSFAADIAIGLPTALTLASDDADLCAELQKTLSTDTLRIYTSPDPIGAELGGALKNVIAIACGICIGAGLGESARAALMTRGYAEMQRMALVLGAQPATLAGLSGFGDLALTCTSLKSRNFSFGCALGAGKTPPDGTIEGIATAKAILHLADLHNVEVPIARVVSAIISNEITISAALEQLLNRPLKEE